MKRLIMLCAMAVVMTACSTTKPVFTIDKYVWPKESRNPKLIAVRVITNNSEFPNKISKKDELMKTLVGDVGMTWIDDKGVRLATSGKGKVYIASPRSKTLQVVDFKKKDITNIRFSSIWPCAVDVTDDGRIFIANRSGGNVMEINEDKKVLWAYGKKVEESFFKQLSLNDKDESADISGLYKDISDIYIHKGHIYVADQLFGKIDVLTLDGKHVRTIPKIPAPIALFVDDKDHIFVLSKFVGKVFEYKPDGTLVKEMMKPGDNIWALNFPNGIATDSEGNLYVIDVASHGLKIYNHNGEFLYFMGTQKASPYLGGFNNPKDVIVDDKDRIYILDAFNRRLVVLQLNGSLYKNGRRDMSQEEPMLRW